MKKEELDKYFELQEKIEDKLLEICHLKENLDGYNFVDIDENYDYFLVNFEESASCSFCPAETHSVKIKTNYLFKDIKEIKSEFEQKRQEELKRQEEEKNRIQNEYKSIIEKKEKELYLKLKQKFENDGL